MIGYRAHHDTGRPAPGAERPRCGPGARHECPDTISALRRGADPGTEAEYRADLIELLDHLAEASGGRVLPGAEDVPTPWLLSSSVAGAELVAGLGLPIAFAHHIRPGNAVEALGHSGAWFPGDGVPPALQGGRADRRGRADALHPVYHPDTRVRSLELVAATAAG
ncbi:hypothetical protein ACIBF5_31370 [Micromonospora sp. NPDC050417]|uniref:hypothetical protein n=1 Tax=Micromonospora sp. NPDC050417 TaxID=3364280 RepID=UPI0037B60E9C